MLVPPGSSIGTGAGALEDSVPPTYGLKKELYLGRGHFRSPEQQEMKMQRESGSPPRFPRRGRPCRGRAPCQQRSPRGTRSQCSASMPGQCRRNSFSGRVSAHPLGTGGGGAAVLRGADPLTAGAPGASCLSQGQAHAEQVAAGALRPAWGPDVARWK